MNMVALSCCICWFVVADPLQTPQHFPKISFAAKMWREPMVAYLSLKHSSCLKIHKKIPTKSLHAAKLFFKHTLYLKVRQNCPPPKKKERAKGSNCHLCLKLPLSSPSHTASLWGWGSSWKDKVNKLHSTPLSQTLAQLQLELELHSKYSEYSYMNLPSFTFLKLIRKGVKWHLI